MNRDQSEGERQRPNDCWNDIHNRYMGGRRLRRRSQIRHRRCVYWGTARQH